MDGGFPCSVRFSSHLQRACSRWPNRTLTQLPIGCQHRQPAQSLHPVHKHGLQYFPNQHGAHKNPVALTSTTEPSGGICRSPYWPPTPERRFDAINDQRCYPVCNHLFVAARFCAALRKHRSVACHDGQLPQRGRQHWGLLFIM